MMNPANMMKMMGALKKFQGNHPKFFAFLNAAFGSGVEEGTIIEMTVTKPGCAPLTTNIKVQQSDLDLLNEIKSLNL